MLSKRFVISLLLVTAMLIATAPTFAQEDDLEGGLVVSHYFGGALGIEAMEKVIGDFLAMHPNVERVESPVDHEVFKTAILVQLAGDNPPDVFSYWAGARVQFIVDSDRLAPIDALWEENGMDDIFPQAIIDNAATYADGQKYLIPFGVHWVGFFYNKALFEEVGAELPETWEDLVAVAEQFKEADIPAFALGSRERWPGQFWFDLILLRTAGPEYRAKLMNGEASYTDEEAVRAFSLWNDLVQAGYFYPDSNAYDWIEAADQVANGEAAMTLMGTWITGHYNNDLGLTPGEDYDYFAFPTIDEGVPLAALGPIDGFVMSQGAPNPEVAKAFMAYLTEPDVQAYWAQGQGCIAPNTNVDTGIYDDVVARITEELGKAEVFAFNYDLATPPPVAEVGLNAFSEFMANPGDFEAMLARVQEDAAAEFAGMEEGE